MKLKQKDFHFHFDSHSVLHLAVNQMIDKIVKHINNKHHFIRDLVFIKKLGYSKLTIN